MEKERLKTMKLSNSISRNSQAHIPPPAPIPVTETSTPQQKQQKQQQHEQHEQQQQQHEPWQQPCLSKLGLRHLGLKCKAHSQQAQERWVGDCDAGCT